MNEKHTKEETLALAMALEFEEWLCNSHTHVMCYVYIAMCELYRYDFKFSEKLNFAILSKVVFSAWICE